MVDEFDLALGEFVGERAGLQVSGVIEIRAPVERRELEESDAQHVTRLGALDGDRADDRVRAPTRVVTAKLGELLDRDAGLEPVHEVGPGVGVYHGVAGVDLYDVGSSCVEGAQTHRFRRGLHRVDPSPRRGDAASECRTRGQETGRRDRGQQTEQAPGADQPPARHPIRGHIRLQRLLVQFVHVLEPVTRASCKRRLHRVGLHHVLAAAVITAPEQSAAQSISLPAIVPHVGSPRHSSIPMDYTVGAVRRPSCDARLAHFADR